MLPLVRGVTLGHGSSVGPLKTAAEMRRSPPKNCKPLTVLHTVLFVTFIVLAKVI